MKFRDSFLGQFNHEIISTRKTLERVPADKFNWRPHDKSMTMGALASHLATIPAWTVPTVEADFLDFAPKDGSKWTPPLAKSEKELLQFFDEGVLQAQKAISKLEDDKVARPWTLKAGDHEIFTMPKAAVLHGFVLSHMIHHRAQLGVYLRLNDIPVPSVYGPSADEGSM